MMNSSELARQLLTAFRFTLQRFVPPLSVLLRFSNGVVELSTSLHLARIPQVRVTFQEFGGVHDRTLCRSGAPWTRDWTRQCHVLTA